MEGGDLRQQVLSRGALAIEAHRRPWEVCALGCPIFHQISPNLLDRRYVDIYGISMGNPSFQSFPMPFRSPTKPIHFTKEIENLRGGNGMPRFFQFLCMKMIF